MIERTMTIQRTVTLSDEGKSLDMASAGQAARDEAVCYQIVPAGCIKVEVVEAVYEDEGKHWRVVIKCYMNIYTDK